MVMLENLKQIFAILVTSFLITDNIENTYIRFVTAGIRRAINIAAYHILQMVTKERNLNLYCNSKMNIRSKVRNMII